MKTYFFIKRYTLVLSMLVKKSSFFEKYNFSQRQLAWNTIQLNLRKKRRTLEKLMKKRFVSLNPTPNNIWLTKCINAFKRSKSCNSTRMKFSFFLSFFFEIIAKFLMQEFDWMEKIIPNMHRILYISKNSKYANREKYFLSA